MKIKRTRFFHILAVTLITAAVFARFANADTDISYDFRAYTSFLEALNEYSIHALLTEQLDFPYVVIGQFAPFEFGFSILAKIFSLILTTPEQSYAAMAAISVGTRVHAMRKFGAPWPWVLLINIYGITLLEANALRLGIASSLIILGLLFLANNRKRLGYISIIASLSIHLQVTIFVGPFIIAWLLKKKLFESDIWRILVAGSLIFFSSLASKILPIFGNMKVSEYVDRGDSGVAAAGLTATSLLAAAFFIVNFLAMRKSQESNMGRQIWIPTIVASIPSIILLVTLTNIAVIGDRAWQLAFITISSIVFFKKQKEKMEKASRRILFAVALVGVLNVTIRHPLSNFFHPFLPEAPVYLLM